MAKPGDELLDPDGGRLIFRQTAGSTDGQLLEMEAFYPPNSELPPEHYHPHQEEHFEVVSGVIQTIIDGRERSYQPGEDFTIPPGVPHAMHNISDEEGHVIWQTRPALRTEMFHETIRGLARDGKLSAEGSPDFLQAVVIAREYNQEFRLKRPPYVIQWLLFAVLAPIGKLKGYRGSYSEYSGGENG